MYIEDDIIQKEEPRDSLKLLELSDLPPNDSLDAQLQAAYLHVTTLSNLIWGFDKYRKCYDKAGIPSSTYPGQFFVLHPSDVDIGLKKAKRLQDKLGIKGNDILIIETHIQPSLLKQNNITGTGLGLYLEQTWIPISNLFLWRGQEKLPIRIEDAVAKSFQLNGINVNNFKSLTPRSISILPVAKGCQAKCPFCFSTSSISSEKKQSQLDQKLVEDYLLKAKKSGASRAVITGGGEPGVLPLAKLLALVLSCKTYFEKVVLISNGYFIAKSESASQTLQQLVDAGLSVLSISRHHYRDSVNAKLMNLDVCSQTLLDAFRDVKALSDRLELRWVCVLQKGGIDTKDEIRAYVNHCFEKGVEQICFKELYVSTSSESPYYDSRANDWSYENQVSLRLVTEVADEDNWELIEHLSWGSPVYRVKKLGRVLTVAAYTEPSLSWEMKNKLCRSWNLMADGNCYASLETLDSQIFLDS